MHLTFHAARQSQRRGVNADLIDCIIQYGEEYKGGGGCSLYRIPEKERRFLKNDDPQGWKSGRDHHRVALVLKGESLITVMHRVKPLRRSRRLI
jgi:hypothetical protein